jgi:hypothetical protein
MRFSETILQIISHGFILFFLLVEYVLFILMKWTDGYPNDKNIHDVSYLTIKYILTSI